VLPPALLPPALEPPEDEPPLLEVEPPLPEDEPPLELEEPPLPEDEPPLELDEPPMPSVPSPAPDEQASPGATPNANTVKMPVMHERLRFSMRSRMSERPQPVNEASRLVQQPER
jgi:hypothetical protein